MRSAPLVIALTMVIAGAGIAADPPDDLQIWQSFLETVRSGQMEAGRPRSFMLETGCTMSPR